MKNPAYYFVTDIETDGTTPLENSMLSFATVVVRQDGKIVDEFEAVLETLRDHCADEATMAFWKTQPEAWLAATTNPEPPDIVMRRFANWVQGFDGKRSFASRPLMLDGIWIDYYLRKFANSYLLDDRHVSRNLFTAGALGIGSYISGMFNRSDPHTSNIQFPADWLGDHEHTHRAIDDARGYAALLSRLLTIADNTPPHPLDFIGRR